MDIAYPQLISLSWYRRSNFIEPSQTRTSSQNHRGKIAPPCRLNSVPKFDEPTRISKYFGLWDTKIKRLSTDKLIARYVYFDSINLLRSIFIEDYIPWIVLKWIVFWTNKLILNLKKKYGKLIVIDIDVCGLLKQKWNSYLEIIVGFILQMYIYFFNHLSLYIFQMFHSNIINRCSFLKNGSEINQSFKSLYW